MDNLALERFENRLRLFKRSRVEKLASFPLEFIYVNALESLANHRRDGIKTKAKLFSGDEMTVVFPDLVSIALRLYGFYEEGLTKMVLEYLKPGMIFIDVGAQFGYYTILGSRIVGDEGQVHSFEPTPNTFQVLKANAEGKPNVHLNNVALSFQTGKVSFNDYGPGLAGLNAVYRWRRLYERQSKRRNVRNYEVATTTLDEYVQSRALIPNLVKIDAEGSEHMILQGMASTIEKFRPMISVEVGDKDIEGVLSSRDLVLYLCQKGYRVFEFSLGGISEHQLKNRYRIDNLFFIPEDLD
jgi:FkbM family methyltransferase